MDIRTNEDNNNRNNIDSEKGAFERFEQELKNTIFGVVFVLLKDDEMTLWTTFIISIIQFLQLLNFPFHNQIRKLWNASSWTDGIEQAVGYLRFSPYFENTTWSVYIGIFYALMGLIVLVIIDIIYVNYAYSKKKYAFSWPVTGLKIVIWLFTTILYIPITDYFFSIIYCVDDAQGNYVHAFFTEEVCWSGIHILHGIVAILGVIIFSIISFVSVLTFYECRSTSNDPSARVNSRANFLLLFYTLVMIACFTFMTGDQYQYILLALILGGSTILFMKFHFNSPYYNEVVAKLWSALTAINLWTAMMLVFSKIMENTLFEGSIIAWIIGVPFIILIVITNRDHRIDLLLINVNKFQNGQEIQNQIRYILKLISWQSTNRNAAILLDGYIEIHKQTCNKEDCPLKQKVVKNSRLTKTLLNNDESLNEKYALLIQLLYKMYFYGIKKFPNNTSLRIAYAFFLLDKMQSRQQALQELSQAEQNKPPFDEQFIIHRYKKIIEDEIAESQNEGQGGLDVVSEIAFQNHLRSCQANIEKSALLHMEFWSQLSEDNPDLGKLNEIGSKINSSVHNVEEHWNKLQKINQHNTKAMRLYGKFLIEIINDKEAGDGLLEKARTIMNVNTNKKTGNFGGAGDDYTNDAIPTVHVSGDTEKFGVITGINLAAASLFGYNKTELINRKVNVLMPQIYSKNHDDFISNYLNNNESYLISKQKERLVFGKNKSNYIFPVYLSLRAVPSMLSGTKFIATFRVEKNFKNAAYILTNPDGYIDSLSSSCINLLKIDLKMVMQKKSRIQDFIPGIIENQDTIFNTKNANKISAKINFNFPKDSEYLQDTNEMTTQLNCFLYDLRFESINLNAGMQYRFEKILDQQVADKASNIDKKAQISNFQFRFDKHKPVLYGEYVEGSTSDVQSGPQDDYQGEQMIGSALDKSDIEGDQGDNVFESATKSKSPFDAAKQQAEPEAKEKINYAEGIKTMRLHQGKIAEPEADGESEEGEDEDGSENGQQKREKEKEKKQQQLEADDGQDDNSFRDFNHTFKSRKALNAVINDKKPPKAIRQLQWTANILMLALAAIAIAEFVVANQEFNEILDNLSLIDQSDQRTAELMNVLSKTTDLYLYNIGVLTDTMVDPEVLKSSIEDSLNAAQTLKISLEKSSGGLSDEHSSLINDGVIPLYELNSDEPEFRGLSQATDQIIARAFEVTNQDVAEVGPDNSDYYFVTYNLLNDYYIALRNSSNFYVTELKDDTDNKATTFLILLIVSIVVLLFSVALLIPVLRSVNKTREEVLSLFLNIPDKTVRSLYTKCENFISNLQVGEDDDVVSEIDDDEMFGNKHEEDNFMGDFTGRSGKRGSKRKFKNSGKSQKKFLLQFLFGGLVVEAYFVYNYLMANDMLNDVKDIIVEINSTSAAEGFYSFVNNAEKQLIIDNSVKILNSNTPEDVVIESIREMYNLDSEIHQEHSVNIKIHSDIYKDFFNDIMMLNPCPEIKPDDQPNCEIFADGAVFQGMAVALTRHFENLRFLSTLYNRYNEAGSTWDQDATYTDPPITGFSNEQTNKFYILRLDQAREIDIMQHEYIKTSFRLLMENFDDGISDDFDTKLTRRLIIFIFYLILLLAIWIIFWLPLISRLANDIWRTKSMLSMIPLNVISNIKDVRIYLKKFWTARSVDY